LRARLGGLLEGALVSLADLCSSGSVGLMRRPDLRGWLESGTADGKLF
jgi:hypothetical protein